LEEEFPSLLSAETEVMWPIDGQAYAWPFCFYSKTGFWPSSLPNLNRSG